jgi:hypothetical protein
MAVRPAVGAQHGLVVALPARHVEGPHAELAHVAERHRLDGLVEAGHLVQRFRARSARPKIKEDEGTSPFIPAVRRNLLFAFPPGFFDDDLAGHAAFLNPVVFSGGLR